MARHVLSLAQDDAAQALSLTRKGSIAAAARRQQLLPDCSDSYSVLRSGAHSGETVIPAIEEHVVVDRQSVETGRLRIRKHVEETETTVDEPLLENTWEVERVAVNRILSGEPPEPRYEGDTLVLPVLEEVLVVEKRLILRDP
ncbi:MAG: DUF2382 domain-containing protein [Bryobacteraceae bacterium]|nr:DUF2382 domain-containing protein [Bryobacteraceae bacterium]